MINIDKMLKEIERERAILKQKKYEPIYKKGQVVEHALVNYEKLQKAQLVSFQELEPVTGEYEVWTVRVGNSPELHTALIHL